MCLCVCLPICLFDCPYACWRAYLCCFGVLRFALLRIVCVVCVFVYLDDWLLVGLLALVCVALAWHAFRLVVCLFACWSGCLIVRSFVCLCCFVLVCCVLAGFVWFVCGIVCLFVCWFACVLACVVA